MIGLPGNATIGRVVRLLTANRQIIQLVLIVLMSPLSLLTLPAVHADTGSPPAVALYEKALALSSPVNPFAPPEYYRYLDQAINLDPDFIQARALKAAGYAASIAHGIQIDGMNFSAMERVVLQDVQEVLTKSPGQGMVYAAQAFIHWHHQRGIPARRSFEGALRLMPGEPDVMAAYAQFLSMIEAHGAAVSTARDLVELEPDTAANYWLLGDVLLYAGRTAEAAAVVRSAVTRFPPGYAAHLLLGQIEFLRGNQAAAMDQFHEAETSLVTEKPYYEFMAIHIHAYARLGLQEDAMRIFKQFETRIDAGEYISASAQALAFLAMGYRDVAFDVLYRSPNEGLKTLQYIRSNILEDPVLEQSRFAELRGRIKMIGGVSNLDTPRF